MSTTRPSYSEAPKNIAYGELFTLQTDIADDTPLDKLQGGYMFPARVWNSFS